MKQNNIFGKMLDKIGGPERTFVVESIERGEESTGTVYSSYSSGLLYAAASREIPVRLISVRLDVDGIEYEIDTSVKPYYSPGENFDGLVPLQLERLEKRIGRTIKMRAKEPYDSGTLKKLARS